MTGAEWDTYAADELKQVRELIETQRTALIQVAIAAGPENLQQSMARMWLLGLIESQLWRIERQLRGDQM